MNEYETTEQAYKNGYKNGYKQGVKDLSEKLKGYYKSLNGKALSASVEYNIAIKVKEMLGED